jgi:MFS family permease
MLGMLLFAMVGSGLMNFAQEISSFFTYTSLSLLGVGMSGLLTASLYLVNEYSTPEHRGYITGIQTFFGVIGIILQTVLGAILY